MSTMLIANNCTVESGSFMGDQLCALKTCYLFVENQPDVDHVIMSVSRSNKLHFLWTKFIEKYNVELIYDNWNPGDWEARFNAWNKWHSTRTIEGRSFDHYREHYLRIHGYIRQPWLCGGERGLDRRNIFEYWLAGQENKPNVFPGADWFDDTLIHHPAHKPQYDVYVSPYAKTQGNAVFTFDFWSAVVHHLVNNGVRVTAGYDGWFCDDLNSHPCFRKFYGTYEQWMEEICKHKVVACGNTGTGWLASACGVPMITMEPHNSVMADHRYRECGLKNIIEVVDGFKLDELNNDMNRVAEYVARRLTEEVHRCVVMTTGCYDIIHAGHIRHLQRARAMGTKLIVAMNSDASIRSLKGPERPINPQEQRKVVLEALKCVDEVRIFDGPNARELIQEVKPDILACGYGYTIRSIIGKDIVEEYGGQVAVTCTKDACKEVDQPSTTKISARVRIADILSVVRAGAPYSVNPPEKLRLMVEEFISVMRLPGDIADCGSYRGGSAFILRRVSSDKHLHLFDTWEGNPYDDDLCHHKKGEWSCPVKDCETLVGIDLLTHYHKGIFPFTTADSGLKNSEFCFVYVDMDTYKATRDAIEYFWPRLVQHGGKMVFDDYGWEPCAGVKKAVDEFFLDQGEETESKMRVVNSMFTCVIEKQ